MPPLSLCAAVQSECLLEESRFFVPVVSFFPAFRFPLMTRPSHEFGPVPGTVLCRGKIPDPSLLSNRACRRFRRAEAARCGRPRLMLPARHTVTVTLTVTALGLPPHWKDRSEMSPGLGLWADPGQCGSAAAGSLMLVQKFTPNLYQSEDHVDKHAGHDHGMMRPRFPTTSKLDTADASVEEALEDEVATTWPLVRRRPTNQNCILETQDASHWQVTVETDCWNRPEGKQRRAELQRRL